LTHNGILADKFADILGYCDGKGNKKKYIKPTYEKSILCAIAEVIY